MFDSATMDASSFDALLIQALNKLDFEKAQAALLGLVDLTVGTKESWDSPQYATSRKVQESIRLDFSRDNRLTFFGLDTLRDRYFLRDRTGVICERPQSFFARVATGVAVGGLTVRQAEGRPFKEICAYAQRLYDALSQLHALFATPILTNMGTNRGLPISCFLSEADDSIIGIYDAYAENAVLAQGGGGIGTFWGNLRHQGAWLRNGGKSSGPIPFVKVSDSSTLAVHQANARRGAKAGYMQVSHPDIEDFVDIRRHEGAEERRCANINHGICITDDFMQAVKARGPWELRDVNTGAVVRTVDAYGLWKRIVMTRVITGEPYLLFIDTVNRLQPPVNKALGLAVKTSNLCIEITLPTMADRVKRLLRRTFGSWRITVDKVESEGRTAICDLGSWNYARYDEWKDYAADLAYLMVRGLDNVLDHFIRTAGRGYEKAITSAKRGRDIGFGVMGWFDYLQQRGIPFESIEARSHNKMRFKEFGTLSDAASRRLAEERGPAPDALRASGRLRGSLAALLVFLGINAWKPGKWLLRQIVPTEFMFRNVNRQALAPTATIGIIAGSSPVIEPYTGNVFNQKTLSGTFQVRNPQLVALLRNKYPQYDNYETWTTITDMEGSVQQFEWMSPEDRKLFKTAPELNQRELIQQAADRQKWISQAQSLNVFFAPGSAGTISAAYLHDVHWMAWELGVKSLYYVRSESVLRAASIEGNGRTASRIIDTISTETCTVCQ